MIVSQISWYNMFSWVDIPDNVTSILPKPMQTQLYSGKSPFLAAWVYRYSVTVPQFNTSGRWGPITTKEEKWNNNNKIDMRVDETPYYTLLKAIVHMDI